MCTWTHASRGLVLIAVALAAFAAASDVEGTATGDPPNGGTDDALAGLRQETHAVLTRGCRGCHSSDVSRENEEALDVFDLQDDRWAAGLSDRRLRKLVSRLEQFGATERDRRRVKAFVDAELGHRTKRRR